MNPTLSLALILALSTQAANRLAFRAPILPIKKMTASKRVPAQSTDVLLLSAQSPVLSVLANGKSHQIKYCSSPYILNDRAVMACSIGAENEEESTESQMGAIVEFVRVESQGHQKQWKKRHVFTASGISSDSNPLIAANGNTFVSVSSEYSDEYSSSGIIVLDHDFKVIQAREVDRLESINWIKKGDSIIFTTNARVNSMYPRQNDLIILDSQGQEIHRASISGSMLGDIIQISETELAIVSEHQTDPRDFNKRNGEIVFVNLDSYESKAVLIPESSNIQIAHQFTDSALILSDSKGTIYEFNRQTLESRKIYSARETLSLNLDSEFAPVLLENGSIAIVTKTNDADFYLYLSIIQSDGSVIQRKLFSATTGHIATSVGLLKTKEGEELIWVGTTGRVYCVTGSGVLKYTLESPRIDNPQIPVVDISSGQWWAGYGNGTRVYTPTHTPASLDPLHFQ